MRSHLDANARRIQGIWQIGNKKSVSFVAGGAINYTLPASSGETVQRIFRLASLEACYVEFGNGDTVATTNSLLILPEIPEFITISGVQNISVLGAIGAGSLNVAEVL